MSSLKFPLDTSDFQNVFLKIEILDQGVRRLNSIVNTIYLPFPAGLLEEVYNVDYRKEDLGILGENIRQNYDSVKGMMRGMMSGEIGFIEGVSTPEYIDELMKVASSSLEREVLASNHPSLKTALHALGYSYAPNYTLMFDGVGDLRQFSLNWKFYPKNVNEANAVEEIIVALEEAALPKLNTGFINSIVADALEYITAPSELTEENQEDKATDTSLASDVIEATKGAINDVASTVRRVGNVRPMTFEIPHSVRITICHKNGDGQLVDVNDLLDLPFLFVINNVILDRNIDANEPMFVENEGEYYFSSHSIRMTITEEQIYTAKNFR